MIFEKIQQAKDCGHYIPYRVSDSKDLPFCSGIYFIVDELTDTIFYIGCSQNIKFRLLNHLVVRQILQDNEGVVLSYWFVPFVEHYIFQIELLYIKAFNPKYNKNISLRVSEKDYNARLCTELINRLQRTQPSEPSIISKATNTNKRIIEAHSVSNTSKTIEIVKKLSKERRKRLYTDCKRIAPRHARFFFNLI